MNFCYHVRDIITDRRLFGGQVQAVDYNQAASLAAEAAGFNVEGNHLQLRFVDKHARAPHEGRALYLSVSPERTDIGRSFLESLGTCPTPAPKPEAVDLNLLVLPQGDRCRWLSHHYHATEGQCPQRKQFGPYCELHASLLGVREEYRVRQNSQVHPRWRLPHRCA